MNKIKITNQINQTWSQLQIQKTTKVKALE